MDANLERVKILQELPVELGEVPWDPAEEIFLGSLVASTVRQMCGRQPRRVRMQDFSDLQRLSFDGLLWQVRRAGGVVRERGSTAQCLWLGAFLCGALARAMAERRRALALQVGRALCDLGFRVEAENIWRGVRPRIGSGLYGRVRRGGHSILSEARPG